MVMKSMTALIRSLAESTVHYFSTVSQSIKDPTVKEGQMRDDKMT